MSEETRIGLNTKTDETLQTLNTESTAVTMNSTVDQQISTSSAEPKPKKRKNIVLIIFLVFFILAILGVGGFFIYKSFFAEKPDCCENLDPKKPEDEEEEEKDDEETNKSSDPARSAFYAGEKMVKLDIRFSDLKKREDLDLFKEKEVTNENGNKEMVDADDYHEYYEIGLVGSGEEKGSKIIFGVFVGDEEEFKKEFFPEEYFDTPGFDMIYNDFSSGKYIELYIIENEEKIKVYRNGNGEDIIYYQDDVLAYDYLDENEIPYIQMFMNIDLGDTYINKLKGRFYWIDNPEKDLEEVFSFNEKYKAYLPIDEERQMDYYILYHKNIFIRISYESIYDKEYDEELKAYKDLQVEWIDKDIADYQANFFIQKPEEIFSYSIDIVEISEEDLEKVGTVKGEDVYHYKDYNKDEFLKKIYEEDYIKGGLNEYNTIDDDDVRPFTLEQAYKYHPVLYWKDYFGRWIRFKNEDFLFVGGIAKPAIYLYPEKTTEVKVKVNLKGVLGTTIPKYNNGWNIIADKNSILTDRRGKKYDYLFWEGFSDIDPTNFRTGWYVEKEDIKTFLEKELETLGFNEKEKAQFIEYWYSKMNEIDNPYLLVNFIDEKFLDIMAPLEIDPKPDSYKRYFMIFKGVDTIEKIEPTKFEKFEREGFFMFEWGGANVNVEE